MKKHNNKNTFYSSKIIKALAAVFILLQLAACNQDAIVALGGNAQNSSDASNTSTTVVTGAVAAKLSWVAPASRADNSPIALSEIAGYRIYYKTSNGVYQRYADINDAYTTEVDIDANLLPANAVAVVMTTVDTGGRESAYSAEVLLGA